VAIYVFFKNGFVLHTQGNNVFSKFRFTWIAC
jgi:hypothetical protein